MNTSLAIKIAGPPCGVVYFAYSQGLVAAWTFLGTVILTSQLLSTLENPLANYCVKRVKVKDGLTNVVLQTPSAQKQMMDEMKGKMQFLNMALSAGIATFIAKKIPADAVLHELFQSTLKSHPAIMLSVLMVASIALLGIAVLLLRRSVDDFNAVNGLIGQINRARNYIFNQAAPAA